MATTTANLGLTLPAVSDPADITPINENFQKLDNALARRIYHANGMLIDDPADGIRGYGTATVTLEPSGLARIDFSIGITQTGSATNGYYYHYGIDRDLLTTLNANIPAITPVWGGVLTVFQADGTLSEHHVGLGAGFEAHASGKYWMPGRCYEASGDYGGAWGGWEQGQFAVGHHLVGTCYGYV